MKTTNTTLVSRFFQTRVRSKSIKMEGYRGIQKRYLINEHSMATADEFSFYVHKLLNYKNSILLITLTIPLHNKKYTF